MLTELKKRERSMKLLRKKVVTKVSMVEEGIKRLEKQIAETALGREL